MLLFLALACAPETAVLAPCWLEPDPPLGELTDEFASQDDYMCSDSTPLGWAIYVGGVDALDGHLADFRFRKTADNAFPAPQSTIEWFLLRDPDGHHECGDVGTDEVLASGTWAEGEEELLVTEHPVFDSAGALAEAAAGASVSVYLATTGTDEPGVRRWWQKDTITFTRTCPEDAP